MVFRRLEIVCNWNTIVVSRKEYQLESTTTPHILSLPNLTAGNLDWGVGYVGGNMGNCDLSLLILVTE